MSGDDQTLEINQHKIFYFKKRSEDNTLYLDEMINKIEEKKNNTSEADYKLKIGTKNDIQSKIFVLGN